MPKRETKPTLAEELEKLIADLEKSGDSEAAREAVERLRMQLEASKSGNASQSGDAWERVLLARHPKRPYTLDYINELFTEFTELHGDRRYGDDASLVC